MAELHQLETVIALLAAVLALATAARRVLIPYPIFLVLGGLVIGVVPNVPIVRLDPDLVFLIFLPPVLWSAARRSGRRDRGRGARSDRKSTRLNSRHQIIPYAVFWLKKK